MEDELGFIEEEAAPTPPVPIRLPDGSAATVPVDDLGQALRAGAQVRDVNADAYKQAAEARTSGLMGGLVAGSAGGLRNLTFGLSDKALIEAKRSLAGDEEADRVREELGEFKDLRPGATMAGGLVGLGAGMIGTGGLGGLAGGALRGATAAPRAISGLGGLAEGAVARVLGETAKSAAGRALQTGVAMGARGATEGALFGASEAVSEATLGDHELSAEKLFAGAEKGALFGAALGGALGVGGSVAASGARGIASLLGRAAGTRALGEVGAEIGAAEGAAVGAEARVGAALKNELKLEAELEMQGMKLGQTPEAMHEARAAINEVAEQTAASSGAKAADEMAEAFIKRRFADNAELADLHRRMYRDRASKILDYDDELNALTRNVTKEGQSLVDAEARLYELVAQEKPEQIARLINSKNMSGAYDAWNGVVREAKDTINFLRESGETGAIVGKGEKALEKLATKIEQIRTGAPDEYVRKTYIALDNFKRELGAAAKFGSSPFGVPPAARAFEDLYEKIRPALEDEAVWGAAGAAQREINAATAKALATKDVFDARFVTKYGNEGGRQRFVFDPQKVETYLKDITGPSRDLTRQSLDDYLAGLRGRIEAAEKHYVPGGRQAKSFAEAKAAMSRLEETLQKAEKNANEIQQIKKLQQIEKDSSLGGILAGAGGMLAIGGGVIPGLAAIVGGAAMRPMQALAGLAKVRSALDRVDEAVRKGAEGLTTKVKISSESAAVTHASARAVARSVADYARDPARMQQVVQQMMGGDLATVAPNTAASFAATVTRAATYLAANAPQGKMTGTLILGNDGAEPRYSASDLDKFAAKMSVVSDPMSVFREAKKGTLNRDKIEALKAVYPKLYQEMGRTVMQQIATLQQKGELEKTLSYPTRIALGMMLGIPADQTLQPDFVRAIQAIPTLPQQQQQPQKRMSNMRLDSSTYQTATERIAS